MTCENCDRLSSELAQARRERDHKHKLFIEMCGEMDRVWDVLGDGFADLDPWDAVATIKATAEKAERELSEARAALEKALEELNDYKAAYEQERQESANDRENG
jgi:hypothetical protein